MRIDRERSFLLIVDLQERLVPAVRDHETVVANAARLMTAAARLEVPILVTEHYPRGIGHTVPALRALAPAKAVLEKIHFCALDEPACARRIAALRRPQAVVTGAEAHVCVLQSVLGLADAGYETYVVADAVASRTPADKEAAILRLHDAGTADVTTEMVLFEWLARGDTDAFRDLLPLIKDAS